MKKKRAPWIAVTQRVVIDGKTAERRDALDQRWADFLQVTGFLPLLLPNSLSLAQHLLASVPVSGVLLTGGNSLVTYGGDAPERDQLEFELLNQARQSGWPVLGQTQVNSGQDISISYSLSGYRFSNVSSL